RDEALVAARRQVANLSRAGYGELAEEVGVRLDRIHSEIRYIDGIIASGRTQEATDRLPVAIAHLAATDTLLERIGAEIDRQSANDLAQASRISAAALTTTLLAL